MLRERSPHIAVALAFCTAWLAPAANAAPGAKGSFEAGLFGGYGMLDDYSGLEPEDDALLGGRFGYFLTSQWSAELSYQQMSSGTDLPAPAANFDFDVSSPRLNILFNFRPEKKLRPFITSGLGLESTEAGTLDESDAGVNLGGGARWYFNDRFGVRLDGRYVYTSVGGAVDESQGNIETTAGVLFAFGGSAPSDFDGDGVGDRKDDCPATPRGAVVDEKGCPRDADADGVFDGIDRCPATPAGCPVDEKGCPSDADADGVIDCQDKCAGTPEGCAVDATGCSRDADADGVCDSLDECAGTAQGCTADASGCPRDSDGDGACDGLDRCSGTAKGCTVDATGCPKDADGDGVCDGTDRCPGTPAGRKVDEKGCELAFDERGTLRLEGVNFTLDSDRLTPESAAVLDRVAASLDQWPDVRVEIGGHTDAHGSEAYNQRLSQQRAEAVRSYLVGKGVAESRMTAKGYGESRPVADNGTDEGRARNRRVELTRLGGS
jgi:outer membrane protein OmpA-like peptidoglycan-associated protein